MLHTSCSLLGIYHVRLTIDWVNLVLIWHKDRANGSPPYVRDYVLQGGKHGVRWRERDGVRGTHVEFLQPIILQAGIYREIQDII